MVIDYSVTINRFTYLDVFLLPKISDLIRQLSSHAVFHKLDLKSTYYQYPIREDERKFIAFKADGGLYQFTRLPFGLTNSVAVFQHIMHNALNDNNLQSTYVYIDDIVIRGRNQEELNANLKAFKEVANHLNLNLGSIPERLKPLKELPNPT